MRKICAAVLLALAGCTFFTGETPTEPRVTCPPPTSIPVINAVGDTVAFNSVQVCTR